MADFNQGDVVRDYMTVVDPNVVGITGLDWTIIEAIDPDSLAFPLTIEEIGDGTYRVSFTATKVGIYYYRVSTIGLTPDQEFENTFTIGPFSIYGATIGTAAYGVTLIELVEMVATELGDLLKLEATADGAIDGSNFTDQLRLAAIEPASLKGAGITVFDPATSLNYLAERRIIDSSDDTLQANVVPNFPAQVITGEKALVTNLKSRGWWFSQYVSNINNAILGIFPKHLIPVSYDYPNSFSTVDPSIPVPTYMTHIYAVHAYDGSGQRVVLDHATANNLWGEGWSVNLSDASIAVGGRYNYWLNGYAVRLLGYGRPAKLVAATDFTTVDADYLKVKAAASMLWSKGDQRYFAQAANLNSQADQSMLSAITPIEVNTIRIR